MRKPKRYDKNYTAAENREIRTLKGQGWSNKEIAQHMGRTEIGISRHWSNINKSRPVVRTRKGLSGADTWKIISTMRETIDEIGFKPPYVTVWPDAKDYGFKVMNAEDYPEGIWKHCAKAVRALGYNVTLAGDYNYQDQTEAFSRGIRVKA